MSLPESDNEYTTFETVLRLRCKVCHRTDELGSEPGITHASVNISTLLKRWDEFDKEHKGCGTAAGGGVLSMSTRR